MTFQVFFQADAVDDLESIHEFISVDDPAAADRMRRKLIEATESLREFPYIGKSAPRSDGARYLVCGSYLVIYDVDEHRREVSVLRFWHAARDIHRLRK